MSRGEYITIPVTNQRVGIFVLLTKVLKKTLYIKVLRLFWDSVIRIYYLIWFIACGLITVNLGCVLTLQS